MAEENQQPARTRPRWPDLALASGMAIVSAGVGMVHLAAGVIAAGVGVIVFAVLGARAE